MQRARNALLALLLALFLPVGAAACGGDDQSEGVEPAETDEGAPTGDEVGETEGEGENLGGEAAD